MNALRGLLLWVLVPGVLAAQAPESGRKLTDAEQKEVQRLTAEVQRHKDMGQFEELAKAAREIADYRAQRQGATYWEVLDARLSAERWQRLTAVPVKDRAEVVRALKAINTGQQAETQGHYREAVARMREGLEIFLKVLGEQHAHTAMSYNQLAFCLNSQGRHSEALLLHRKALEIRRQRLGEQHPDTATSYNQTAWCLSDLGQHAKALPLYRKALEIWQKTLGEQHYDTADGYNNLALCLDDQGQHVAALPLHYKALAIRRQILGEQDTSTAESYNNLALCLDGQGQHVAALPLHQKALEFRLQVLGEQHPATLTSYNNVAFCLNNQGRYAEALILHHKTLELRRKVLGEQHPHTAITCNNLAFCLNQQGRYAEALPLYQKALEICQKVLGEQHTETAASYNGVGFCLSHLGRYAEAQTLYRKALEFRRKALGEQHPDTALSFSNVALCLNHQGKYIEALPLHQKALEIRRQVLGEQHPDTLTSLNNLAFCLNGQGKSAAALLLYRQTLETRRQMLGEQHLHTAQSYSAVARCLSGQGQHAEAVQHWEKARLGWEFGPLQASVSGFERSLVQVGVLSPRAALAVTLVRLGQPERAWEHAESDLGRGLLDDLLSRPEVRADGAQQKRLRQLDQALLPLLTREKLTNDETSRRNDFTRQRDALLTEMGRIAVQRAQERVLPRLRIQQQIPADAAVVFWLDTLDQHLGCILRREGPPLWVSLPGSGKEAAWARDDAALPERTLKALVDGNSDPATGHKLLAQLRRQRLQTLEPHLKNVRYLLVVPAGRMAKVPVESLTDRYTISYIPSASIFARVMEKHRALQASSLLVLADPTFQNAGTTPPPAPRHGVFVAAVLPDSLAAKVGLRAGDVLLEYGDALLLRPDDLQPTASIDRIPIKLWREGQTIQGRIPAGKLGVVLDKRPVGIAVAHWRSEQLERAVVRSKDWQSLPGTRLEARTLAALLPQTTTLLGSEASEQKLNQLASAGKLKDFRLLHLATHGEANDALPKETALILAQDKLPTPDEAAKLVLAGQKPPTGRLTVGQVLSQWDLDADLVVLSACQTGLGKQTTRDGMLGFTQALLQKGARSVVLSRWKVDDAATALLMARFYQNLLGKREGLKEALPRAGALREAKTWLRQLPRAEAEKRLAALIDGVPRSERGTIRPALPTRRPETPQAEDRPFAHPYYWAAFILVGDPK